MTYKVGLPGLRDWAMWLNEAWNYLWYEEILCMEDIKERYTLDADSATQDRTSAAYLIHE